jgi:hypothetical protein
MSVNRLTNRKYLGSNKEIDKDFSGFCADFENRRKILIPFDNCSVHREANAIHTVFSQENILSQFLRLHQLDSKLLCLDALPAKIQCSKLLQYETDFCLIGKTILPDESESKPFFYIISKESFNRYGLLEKYDSSSVDFSYIEPQNFKGDRKKGLELLTLKEN